MAIPFHTLTSYNCVIQFLCLLTNTWCEPSFLFSHLGGFLVLSQGGFHLPLCAHCHMAQDWPAPSLVFSCLSAGVMGPHPSCLPSSNRPVWWPGRVLRVEVLQVFWVISLSSNTLPPDVNSRLFGKGPDAGKDWRQEGEEGARGWDGWMASSTQWTWVWASSGRWWRTGRPELLQSMGSQRVRRDLATEQQDNNLDLAHLHFPCILLITASHKASHDSRSKKIDHLPLEGRNCKIEYPRVWIQRVTENWGPFCN